MSLKLSQDERRYAVFNVSDAHLQDFAYFDAIRKQMDEGGLEAMLRELLDRPFDKQNLLNIPDTEGLRDQKQLTLPAHEKWWYEKLQRGTLFDFDDIWYRDVRRSALHADFKEKMRGFSAKSDRAMETDLGNLLRDVLPTVTEGWRSFPVMDGKPRRERVWIIPTLDDCRAHFDAVTGVEWDWPDINEPDLPDISHFAEGLDPYADGFPDE
jgi:hypothetical protein